VDYATACYRALGCELMERSQRRGAFDVAFLGAGSDVLLEFQGPPPPAESEECAACRGWSIERVALACDDAASARARLAEAGVTSAWEPAPFAIDGTTLAISAGVQSPEGLMIDLVQHADVAVPRPARGERGDLALHHVCLLTRDLTAAEKFWTSSFGLVKTYDFTAPDGETGKRVGFVMLGDEHFDGDGPRVLLGDHRRITRQHRRAGDGTPRAVL